MCGIAGILKFNNQSVQFPDLKRMTDSIQHRGPDGEGHWINEKNNVGFGHRRLSIIDLSNNAKQPMHYLNNRYTITFNGEIYNYIELKKELETKSYQFKSSSDTEVLLALYDLKKEKCLNDLDGMFAFAIWDEKEQQLFCARDRFGEKPFHYFLDKNEFVFCSEIKQLWAYGITKKINATRLNGYITNTSLADEINPEKTFYDTVNRIDAAHYMYIKTDGTKQITNYWSIDLNAKPFSGSIEEAYRQFLNLLTHSVKLRLRSDVSVGSSLSGGLDSSSIVLLIDKLKGNEQKQNSFSARFKNFEKDEGKYIEEVVKACKNVNNIYTWPDEDYFLQCFDKVNFHQDEPYNSASIVAQYAVMELAKKHNTTVLLDGQGADEYLAGYLSYYKLYINQLFYNNTKKYNSEIIAFNKLHPSCSFNINETLQMKLGRYKKKILAQAMPFSKNELNKQLKVDTTNSGLKELLRYCDRNSMAHSREVRLPFLDHKLVEFVFTLPDEYKLNLGWTKYVLRKSMENILPKSICWRSDKIGYEPPQNSWLKSKQIEEQVKKAIIYFGIDTKKQSIDNFKILVASYYAN